VLTNGKGQDFFFVNSKKIPGKELKNFVYNRRCPKDNTRGYIRACFFKKTGHGVFANSSKRLFVVGSGANDTLSISTLYEPISLGPFSDTLFWIGFRYGGVGIFDLSGRQVQSFLPGKSVTKLYIDHEGGYWFSTLNDGVYHSGNTCVRCYANNSMKTHWINALAKDSSGNLWIGYYNGDVSVLSENKITDKYISTEKKPALVKYDPVSRKVYFITDYRLFISDKKDPRFDMRINPLNFYIHRNDSVLIASYSAINVLYHGKRTQLNIGFRITDICSRGNDIYLGSLKGLYTLKNQNVIPVNNNSLLASSKISDLDSKGEKLLLGTKGTGLLVLENNTVSRIHKKNGLSSDIINKIYIENDTVFWACTNNGLNHIVFKNKMVSRIDIISNHNGLISNEITSMELIKDTVWVGTREGLCYFPKSMLYKKNPDINYHLTISRLKVNDSVRALTASTCLHYNENRVEFNFSAASFTEFSPLLYRYKLAGIETQWNYTSALSSLYPSLPARTYTFIVQVKGDNSSWERGEQKFLFTILPPWWKTWWFITSVFILVITLIYLFFRFRILSYNRDITREILRYLLKRLTKKTQYVVFKEQGKDIRIPAGTICFVKASGNYIEIQTDIKKYVVRHKISEFLKLVPDPLEYLRVNRSCIVRLDKIQEKSKKTVTVRGETIAIGETYTEQLQKIKF
jgi:hypothetical protein